MKKRNLKYPIQKIALDRSKMVLISGPRQSGKTTLGKSLLKDKALYFNWDQIEFKKKWKGGCSLFAEFI